MEIALFGSERLTDYSVSSMKDPHFSCEILPTFFSTKLPSIIVVFWYRTSRIIYFIEIIILI